MSINSVNPSVSSVNSASRGALPPDWDPALVINVEPPKFLISTLVSNQSAASSVRSAFAEIPQGEKINVKQPESFISNPGSSKETLTNTSGSRQSFPNPNIRFS